MQYVQISSGVLKTKSCLIMVITAEVYNMVHSRRANVRDIFRRSAFGISSV